MNLDLRRLGRERALGLLYESETKGISPAELIMKLPMPPDERVVQILEGIQKDQEEIDEIILKFSKGWKLERMPAVDLAIMRIAIYELKNTEEPPNAIVNEAIELSKEYSTGDSGKFINGILASVLQEIS